jgi:hypothetical protein
VDRPQRSRCASACPGIRKHIRGHSGPATHGRSLSPAPAGAGAGGQPAPLGVRAPAGSPPRAARTSPSGIPLASVDLWPCATRFRALHTGEVICAIPDLHAVGSALRRPRLKAVGSVGRAGHTAHATIVHSCAMRHTAEARPPRRPDRRKLAREWSESLCQSAQPPAGRSVQRLRPPSLSDCPHCLPDCQAMFWPPSGVTTRSNRYGALPHCAAPQGPPRARACGLLPSLPRPALAPQTALWGRRAGSSRACHHTGASSSTADGTADPSRRRHTSVRSCLSVDVGRRHCACRQGTLAPGRAGAGWRIPWG